MYKRELGAQSVGFLIHARWADSIFRHRGQGRVAFCDLHIGARTMRAITAHMPTTSHNDQEYIDVLSNLIELKPPRHYMSF